MEAIYCFLIMQGVLFYYMLCIKAFEHYRNAWLVEFGDEFDDMEFWVFVFLSIFGPLSFLLAVSSLFDSIVKFTRGETYKQKWEKK